MEKAKVEDKEEEDDDTEFNKECLKVHNKYRAKHGVAPLKMSKKVHPNLIYCP